MGAVFTGLMLVCFIGLGFAFFYLDSIGFLILSLVPIMISVDKFMMHKRMAYRGVVDGVLNIIIFELLLIPVYQLDSTILASAHLMLMYGRFNHHLQYANNSKFVYVVFVPALMYLLLLIGGVVPVWNPFGMASEAESIGIVLKTIIVVSGVIAFVLTLVDNIKYVEYIRNVERSQRLQSKRIADINSIIAHNLRTPLANIITQLEIAELVGVDQDRLATVKQSAAHTLEQVNLIVFARKCFELNPKICDFLYAWSAQFNDHRIDISCKDIPWEMTENQATSLHVALTIFTSNSFEHGADSVKISVEAAATLKVVHRDNGEGMKPEVVEKFGSPLNSSKKGHSGIGVYYATRLLETAGIQWKVSSKLVKGTTIEIEMSE